MFRSKKDVDRHVQDILRKVKSENERNLRCYNIAQQYYKVRDFESAKHYLSLYLSVKEDSPLAHKLQGQIWEGLGDKVRALNAYKTSLEYEANQPDLVLKMCQLLCETDVAMDVDRAHYWCERAADLFPHDPAVFRLKEKLLKLGGKANTHDFENLINSEMKARPDDVIVRTRLMRLYLETGRTKTAYSHATEVEASQVFRKELPWYECFAQICQAYADEFPSQVDWQFYCSWVSVLDRVASLSMCELSPPKKIVDCVQAIFSMDQVLYKASNVTAPKDHAEVYKQFLRHMSAQLCLHISTLILKRAKKEPSNWREATRSVSPLLFLALSPPPDTEAPWCLQLRPNLKLTVAHWASDAYYRLSQAGYTLLALAKDAGNQFTEKVTHMATGNWRERTFQRLFTGLDHRAGVSTSHFVLSDLLAKVSVRLPVHDSGFLKTRQLVPVYEKVRDSLHHLVWLGLETAKHNGDKLPPDFHTYGFSRLKFTTHNLSNMSVETLSVLDVDAFIYATVLCAAAILEDEVLSGLYASDRPVTLPADISNLLCTQEQMSWWAAACQVNSQQFSGNTNLVTLRQRLQRGLEVVRVDGNHGLDVQLIVRLARTFADRAASVGGKKEDQSALESRASLYWNAALPMLERMERNQTVRVYNSKLFEYPRKELSSAEISSLLEEGRYFIACQLMKSEQYERAVEAFKSLRSPYASFNQALIYKKLAAKELEERPREEITSEMRSKHVILLTKARDCLNVTWERIRIDRQHPLHQTLPEHMGEVESALSRIEPDPDMDHNIFGTSMSLDFSVQQLGLTYHSSNLNRSEGEMTEPSVSSVHSPAAGDMGLPHSAANTKLNGHTAIRTSSTPRRHTTRYTSTTPEHRRHNNGELVDVGQLLQIQALHDEVKKVCDDQKRMCEEQKKMNEKLDMLIECVSEMRRDKLKPTGVEDLYIFGDEEEYPEDVLSGQYQPTFVPSYQTAPQPTPTFYPAPPRGVQGTSTVTYGAPPPAQQPTGVIPLIPMRMPLDPTLAGYQTPQNLAFYNQGTLPFAEPQHLPDFLRQNIPKSVIPPQQPQAPVNVVITTSDTLPTGPPPVQPTLSVTIPPQHRLGTLPPSSNTPPTPVTPLSTVATTPTSTPPHKFQIPMPPTATTPSLEKSPIVIPDEDDSEDDNEVELDPYPDFKPIIPLPNEVHVTTGEENDDVIFENRAKLFRFVDKEWKERGIGIVKILKNRSTEKVRLLMRRDQVHKICANHLLRSDMDLTMLKNSDRALVWVANDYAEETFQLEKFCIKFKTPEEASKFKDVFNDAKTKYGQSPQKPKEEKVKEVKQSEKSSVSVKDTERQDLPNKVNLGGFTFTSPPKLKEPTIVKPKLTEEIKKESQPASSPFASFSFTPQKPASNLSTSLFAGLNNTQNKHNLFENNKEDITFDNFPNVSNEAPRKLILKQPTLPSVEPTTQDGTSSLQPKSHFNFTTQSTLPTSTPKDIPKSILKETPVSSPKSPVSNAKSSPNTKHVLFQDTTSISPSQQTPTLSALLSTPKAAVVDFAALSKMNENQTPQFGNGNKSKGFEGAGTPVFGGNRSRNDSESEPVEEFVPSAEFRPVIPLPELVEIKTGEEGQEILFNERAKLMRFDPDAKEWKERGLGQMKILKDPTTGITRFLMRREQVYKVCCNHRIIQSMELRPSPSNEKAWTWYAVDYAEGEMKNELFAIRFKTVELAKQFKEIVDVVQKQLREEGTSKRSCPDSSPQGITNSTSNVLKSPTGTQEGEMNLLPKLSELYRPKSGSWECKACYTVNGVKDSTCVCCDSPKEKPKSPAPNVSPKTPEKKNTEGPSLAEMFKPKAGSWECDGCLVRNDGDKTICPACSTPKPGHENDAKESAKSSTTFGSSSFSFGIKPTDGKETGFSFGVKPEATQKSSFSFGIKQPAPETSLSMTLKESENKPLATTGFSFGLAATATSKSSTPFTFAPKTEVVATSADSTTPTVASETKEGSPFKFGALFGGTTSVSKTSFMFGTSNTLSDSTDNKVFGSTEKHEFCFSGVKPCKSPGSQSGGRSPGSQHGQDTDSDNEEVDEEEGDHLIFQPIVPLPDKVPLTTGEEEEEVLYSHRAKLFRYAQGEWKERGVGDIKILRHNTSHKIRLLMRREPLLKICLNHFLTVKMTFCPKDDRSWLWSAPDFADGQLTTEQFCLRLKTPEIAAEFKAAVDSAQGELEATRDERRLTEEPVSAGEAHDVEVVYEVKVPEELREAALRLQLPPNFYSYLNKPPCPGCRGCEPYSEEDEPLEKGSALSPSLSKSTAVLSSSVTTTTVSQPFVFTVKTTPSQTQPTTSSDSTPATSTSDVSSFSFNFKTTTATTSVVDTLFGNVPSQPATPTVSTPSTTLPSFSFSLNTTSTPSSGNTLFNNAVSDPQSPSIFGGSSKNQSMTKSVFGGTSFTETTPTAKTLLFGTTASTNSATTLSFGTSQNIPTSLFKELSSNETPKATPVFNFSFDSTPKTSIFGGGDTSKSPSVFGTPVAGGDSSSTKNSPFFSNLNTPQTTSPQAPDSGFEMPITQNQSVFGGNSQPGGGFFNSLSATSTGDGPSFLFKETPTFSDIAAASKPSFGSDSSNFKWTGAGTSVFGSAKTAALKASVKEGSGEESAGEDDDESYLGHDPVFEPIVPLPDRIEVRTGEEDEDREFCSRAKFYRYDSENKEWKERGTGDMKILRHRETNTYRLLLRREQIHKVVCNQLITAEMELQNLSNSETAYCWAGMNMAEEYEEPRLEKVAVRFKNKELAEEFKTKIEKCIEIVKCRKENAVSEVIARSAEILEPSVNIEEIVGEYSEGSGDYCEGDYLDSDDGEPMFEKRATLYEKDDEEQWLEIGQGELKFFYNQETSMGNITFRRDNSKEQMMISAGPESNVEQLSNKEITWYGQHYDLDMSFSDNPQMYKAEFCTPQAAGEFLSVFHEVLELSQTCDSSYLDSENED